MKYLPPSVWIELLLGKSLVSTELTYVGCFYQQWCEAVWNGQRGRKTRSLGASTAWRQS